jgi:hypothetical protein
MSSGMRGSFDLKRRPISEAELGEFLAPLCGLRVSHIWRGYGSAIFLECGILTPSTLQRRDGSFRNPTGEFTLAIEWSWRIEGKRRIWCGSWDDEARWPRFLSFLQSCSVVSASLVGRIPEIDVSFSNGLHLVSCNTSAGDPQWGIIEHLDGESRAVGVIAGRLFQEEKRYAR